MNILSFFVGFITLKIHGMNVEKFILILTKSNIFIKSIKRVSYNEFYLKTNCFYYKKLLEQADKLCYNISVVKVTGLYGFFTFIKSRMALAIIIGIGGIFAIASCFFVWQIKVYGTDNIDISKINSVLSSNNICVGVAKNNIDVNYVEQILYDNFDNISLVSATIHGTTLVVNVKEKLYVPEMQPKFEPLIATKDGIIEKITLISGTLNCKVGDTVKVGDVLVYPYVIDASGDKKPIIALAEISAYVDVVGKIEYNTNQIEYTRTGESIITKSYNLFGIKISLDKNVNTFDNYQIESYDYYVFHNNLLPLKITKTIYFQTIGKEIVVDFDKVKDNQIYLSQKLAYDNLPQGIEVINEQTVISNNQNIYYVFTYLKTLQSIV